MVCVSRGIAINRLVGALPWCVCGLVLGRGLGVVGGWHCWWFWGAGVGVALFGSLGIPRGRVGVAFASRTVLVVPGWLRCRGTGRRRPHGHSGSAVVRRSWVAVGGWCLLVWGVGRWAAGVGGLLLLGPGAVDALARLRAGPRGCTVVRMSWARVVGPH